MGEGVDDLRHMGESLCFWSFSGDDDDIFLVVTSNSLRSRFTLVKLGVIGVIGIG